MLSNLDIIIFVILTSTLQHGPIVQMRKIKYRLYNSSKDMGLDTNPSLSDYRNTELP